MKYIIYGGSFDPIHNGHIQMALKAKEVTNADKVIFLLSKRPRWKNPLEDENHRLNMLKLALKDVSWAEIDLTEYNSLEDVNYTYRTILKIKNNYPGDLFFLIGGDNVNQLNDWYEIDNLSKAVKLIAIARPDIELDQENIERYNVSIISSIVSNMSSTSLRNMSNLDCPIEVLQYIIENNLYFVPRLKEYISEKRFNHSYEVAKLAYRIAKSNNLNEIKAFTGGLLHDIGKGMDKDKQRAYMALNYPEFLNELPPPLYHQFISRDICINDFNISDQEILNSIVYHATGNSEMTPLGKVIYSSDKIEPTRGYDSSDMIKACLEDYQKGFEYVLKENIKFLKEANKSYDNVLTRKCINYYLKER